MGTTDLPGGDSSVSKDIIRIDILGKCQNTHIKSLAYKVRAIIVEKAKRKNFTLPNPNPDKIVNKKHNVILVGGWQKLVFL